MQVEAGTVLGCWFPEEGLAPGPKFRPVVVLDVFTNQKTGVQELLVAYGSSQHTSLVYPWEFTVSVVFESHILALPKFG